MSGDFQTTRLTRSKRDRFCETCRDPIPQGTPHDLTSGRFDGSFYLVRWHTECHGLWLALFDGFSVDGCMDADLVETLAETDPASAQAALDAQRTRHPDAVARLERRLRWFLEPDADQE